VNADDGLFARPAFLWLLALVPIAWAWRRAADLRAARLLAEIVGPRLDALAPGRDAGARRRRTAASACGVLFAVLALAAPRWGEREEATAPRGADVIVCLDVSRSMLAQDAAPTRLEAAKNAVRALLARAEGDRVGLVVFAGEAKLVVPLTRDAATFSEILGRAGPLTVANGGTDLGLALDAALAALAESRGDHAAIVVATDGEDLAGRGAAVAASCRARGVPVHAVGFGSTRGAKIAVPGERGQEFVRDPAGGDVVTAFDPASLRRLSDAAGGEFVDATASPDPLVALYDARIRPAALSAFEVERRRGGRPRFQWPLALAFCAFAFAASPPLRRRA
jgi:Ca-activated chloride channel family protein